VESSIVYLSAYTIGKEKVIFAVCDELHQPIYMDDDKMLIMRQIEGGSERIERGLFVNDPSLAHIHVCKMGFAGSLHPFFKPHFENITASIENLNKLTFLQARTVPKDAVVDLVTIEHSLAFIPSGWADSGNFNRRSSTAVRGNCTVQLIAYSEHSQCNELMEFVGFLRPKQVVPTVFSDDKQRISMLNMFSPLLDRRDRVQRFFMRFPQQYSSLKKNSVELRVDSSLVESADSDQNIIQVVGDDDNGDCGLSSTSNHLSLPPSSLKPPLDGRPSMPTTTLKLSSMRANKKPKMSHTAVNVDQAASTTLIMSNKSCSPIPWQCIVCTFKHCSAATADYLQCSICFTPRNLFCS